MAHTAGPWFVWEPETEHGTGDEPAKTIVVGKDKPDDVTQEIAYVNCESFYFDGEQRAPIASGLIREPHWPTAPVEAIANARLIAAAPLLLAYAECEQAYRDWFIPVERTQRSDKRLSDVLGPHGYTGPLDSSHVRRWLTGLRRRALAAAHGEGS